MIPFTSVAPLLRKRLVSSVFTRKYSEKQIDALWPRWSQMVLNKGTQSVSNRLGLIFEVIAGQGIFPKLARCDNLSTLSSEAPEIHTKNVY